MNKGVPFKTVLRNELKNPEVKKAFDEEGVFADIAIQVARMREQEGLTQGQLARRIHTKQQAISRIESLNYRGYSVRTLSRIARAMKRGLKIEFV
jgi:ribosome-binding protein aMBF1 (putative translation factor)